MCVSSVCVCVCVHTHIFMQIYRKERTKYIGKQEQINSDLSPWVRKVIGPLTYLNLSPFYIKCEILIRDLLQKPYA